METKTKLFLQELFLILASIIGMGFASGKEIVYFFCYNKLLAGISILIFVALFFVFFTALKNFQRNHNIKTFNELNDKLFKDSSNYVKYILIFIYSICASAMLSGVDILSKNLFNLDFPIFSIILSIILFFTLIGGVGRINNLFLKILPFLLILILLNLSVNSFNVINGDLISLEIFNTKLNAKEIIFSIILPIIFWGGNTILAINSILQIKTKPRLTKWLSAFIFLIFMLMGAIVIVGYNSSDSMPFLTASLNLSKVFYALYLIGIFIALFSSLIISSHNITSLLNIKNKFGVIIVILINQSLAFLGFDFIVSYLYTFSGILGMIYCFVVLFKIIKTKNKI